MESNTDINYEETKTTIKFFKRPAFNPGNTTEKVSPSSSDNKKVMDVLEKLEKILKSDNTKKYK